MDIGIGNTNKVMEGLHSYGKAQLLAGLAGHIQISWALYLGPGKFIQDKGWGARGTAGKGPHWACAQADSGAWHSTLWRAEEDWEGHQKGGKPRLLYQSNNKTACLEISGHREDISSKKAYYWILGLAIGGVLRSVTLCVDQTCSLVSLTILSLLPASSIHLPSVYLDNILTFSPTDSDSGNFQWGRPQETGLIDLCGAGRWFREWCQVWWGAPNRRPMEQHIHRWLEG